MPVDKLNRLHPFLSITYTSIENSLLAAPFESAVFCLLVFSKLPVFCAIVKS